jgi:hypothetical protein
VVRRSEVGVSPTGVDSYLQVASLLKWRETNVIGAPDLTTLVLLFFSFALAGLAWSVWGPIKAR